VPNALASIVIFMDNLGAELHARLPVLIHDNGELSPLSPSIEEVFYNEIALLCARFCSCSPWFFWFWHGDYTLYATAQPVDFTAEL